MKPTFAQLRLVREEYVTGSKAAAAMLLLHALNKLEPVNTEAEGEAIIWGVFRNLIEAGHHAEAATLCFDGDFFCAEPELVQRALKSAHEKELVMFMGASSVGKTYNLVIYCYLEWLYDPFHTGIKLMSQTDSHLRQNLWPHLIVTHENCALKLPQKVKILDTETWMGVDGAARSSGFNGIAFKQSATSSGAFKSFKSRQVRKSHEANYDRFGPFSRLFILMDEAQQIPEGVWQDLNSPIASLGGHRVKIFAAFNPEDLSQPAVMRCEPPEGWMAEQLETLYSYQSRHGWWVERLDAAKSENVIQRKEIYPGLMKYEAYLKILSGGGDNSARYMTFLRGFPPLQSAANTVIPPDWVSSQRGEAIYIGSVINVASEDLAYQGQDKALMCIGRWGLASGWRDQSGKVHHFMDRLNPGRYKHRHVLTIDQFFPLSKQLDPVGITQEIMGKAKLLGIKAENTACDMTGNALATYSYMAKYWGNVLGINWAHGSTDTKILTDDIDTCKNRFDGIPSEMWFAFKEWLNPAVGAVLFNPTIQSADIYTELTSRRFQTSRGNRLKVEGKDIYKARNGGRSPDHADVVIQLVHLIRMRMGVTPGVAEEQGGRKKEKGAEVPVKPIAHSFKRDLPDTEGELEVAGSGVGELEGTEWRE